MTFSVLANGATFGTIRAAINSMFLDLYSGVAAGVLVGIGDSISVGYLANNVGAINLMTFPSAVAVNNLGVSGQTQATEYSNAQSGNVSGYYTSSETCVAVVQGGTNDLGTSSTAGNTLYSGTTTPLIALLKSQGFYVLLCTVLPRADSNWSATKETQRQAYNSLVRANSAGADAILDLASDPMIGDSANANSNTSIYVDGLHLTAASQAYVAPLYQAALIPLLRSAVRAKTAVSAITLTSPSFGTGKFGQALTGGTGSLAGSVLPASGPATIEMWASSSSSSGLNVLMGAVNGGNIVFYVGENAGKATFAVAGTNNVTGTEVVSDGAFHHFALVDNGSGTTTLWVDGVSQGSIANSIPRGSYSVTERTFVFNSTTYSWDGGIDEIAISNIARYTTAFTPPTAAYTGSEAGITGVWHLDGDGVGVA